MREQSPTRCLILACGNTLRSDDGVGPWLAQWAEKRFRGRPDLHILSRQQWTPELAEDISRAEAVLFIDCSIESPPGLVKLASVEPVAARPFATGPGLATHHMDAAALLELTRGLYATLPRNALLLTVGAGSTELGEQFSAEVEAALPQACRLLEETALQLLAGIPREETPQRA
jgi:hydrogenase maturation protease